MKHYILIVLSFILSRQLFAQAEIDMVVAEILKNNTTLQALRQNADAEKLGNKTGIYLSDPEVEFNYLWGSPSLIGNRTDIRVQQSFDFPTAYKFRRQIADLRNNQVEFEFQRSQRETATNVRQICVDLTYNQMLRKELSGRVESARRMADSYQAKFAAGEANILEVNKTRLVSLSLSKELERLEIEGQELLSGLARLNGGIPVNFSASGFQPILVPSDFEQWYAQAGQTNPVLQWLKQQVEVLRKQEKLNVAQSMPGFQTGYMSEKVVGQHFQGVTAGISIPLWENKNTIKHARAQAEAAQSMEADQKLQFYNQLKAVHGRAVSLQKNLADYRQKLQECSNSDLLQKALAKGEISLVDYLFELTVYYDSVNRLLESERDLNQAWVELNRYN